MKGCDGSILIETKKGSKKLAEREAYENKELREEGFDSIIKAKALVESHCPSLVSCSDILAIAARDFIHLVIRTSILHSYFRISFHSYDLIIDVSTVQTGLGPNRIVHSNG